MPRDPDACVARTEATKARIRASLLRTSNQPAEAKSEERLAVKYDAMAKMFDAIAEMERA